MNIEEEYVTLTMKDLAIVMALSAGKQVGKDEVWVKDNYKDFIPAALAIRDSSVNIFIAHK